MTIEARKPISQEEIDESNALILASIIGKAMGEENAYNALGGYRGLLEIMLLGHVGSERRICWKTLERRMNGSKKPVEEGYEDIFIAPPSPT